VPIGTAGLERRWVSGKKARALPPPRMTTRTSRMPGTVCISSRRGKDAAGRRAAASGREVRRPPRRRARLAAGHLLLEAASTSPPEVLPIPGPIRFIQRATLSSRSRRDGQGRTRRPSRRGGPPRLDPWRTATDSARGRRCRRRCTAPRARRVRGPGRAPSSSAGSAGTGTRRSAWVNCKRRGRGSAAGQRPDDRARQEQPEGIRRHVSGAAAQGRTAEPADPRGRLPTGPMPCPWSSIR